MSQKSQPGPRSLPRLLLPCLLLPLFLAGAALEAQQDPFKRGRENEQDQASGSAAGNTAKGLSRRLQQWLLMPPWFLKWQRSIQAQVSDTALRIRQLSWRDSWHLYLLGFVFSIIFGFLHIAGPGHGKLFTISYFMSRKTSLKEGMWLSVLINIVDSLSAGLVVFLSYGLLGLTFSQGSRVETIVSIFSYGIIVLWSLWHLGSHIFGHLRGGGHHCSHRHALRHKPHSHDGHPHCEHAHTDSRDSVQPAGRPAWYFALGIGLVPCPISTALLIFGLLNQILGIAIFLVAGISLGGMLAMTLLSFAVIGGKKGLGALLLLGVRSPTAENSGQSKLLSFLSGSVEVIALLLMMVIGTLFLLLSLPV